MARPGPGDNLTRGSKFAFFGGTAIIQGREIIVLFSGVIDFLGARGEQ
jgi:hypothetical protein